MTSDATLADVSAPFAAGPRVRARVPMPLIAHATTDSPTMVSFHGLRNAGEHVALVVPGPSTNTPLVRVHSECLTGDVFTSARCDCGAQLDEALTAMTSTGGILLYLRQEGRGIGLYNKLDAYRLQDAGYDTLEANLELNLPADARRYGVAADMLAALGVDTIVLMTNNPDKVQGLRAAGVDVVRTVSTGVHLTEHNRRYLRTKATRLRHRLKA